MDLWAGRAPHPPLALRAEQRRVFDSGAPQKALVSADAWLVRAEASRRRNGLGIFIADRDISCQQICTHGRLNQEACTMIRAATTIAFVFLTSAAFAQTASQPAFDVASVKALDPAAE